MKILLTSTVLLKVQLSALCSGQEIEECEIKRQKARKRKRALLFTFMDSKYLLQDIRALEKSKEPQEPEWVPAQTQQVLLQLLKQ